ncbi:hypothetical protein [Micromonospora purpureochromogenes]|uniref:Suppressor of fused protein (SUFU) n=1 Tax=Micromonospora purpureochromogenes TaxID=47872 RepID=A0ABX2RDL5_9ACTN|nr:hypothetical protein [Micromonospora purpureochromogenes]NYF54572.1 hypothetical protein [Micromonospora purpureochromogenes]
MTTVATDAADAAFSYLARNLIPLVVMPPGPLPRDRLRLRGLVRVGAERVRVAVTVDPSTAAGVAIEFPLTEGEEPLAAEAVVGFIRTVDVKDLVRVVGHQPRYDNHRNAVVDAESVGFRALRGESATDLNLFALFSLLVHGGGFPWFEDVYTFAGFMLTGDGPCRCYVRVTGTGAVYGLDIPLRDTAGRPLSGFTSLPQELAPLIREKDLFRQPQVDDEDEYCEAVYDLSQWV